MRHLKLFIIYFLLTTTVYILILLLGTEFFPIHTNIIIVAPWIAVLLFTIAGFLVGVTINELFIGFVNKEKVTHGSYITFLITFTAFFGISRYNSWNYQKLYGNIDANKSTMKYLVSGDEGYVPIAFKKLESCFKDPNDIRISSFRVKKKDTIINEKTDTLFNVYFRYFHKLNYQKEYVSKVSVFQSIAKVNFFNANGEIKFEDIDSTEKNYYDKEIHEHIKESLQKLSDSDIIKINNELKILSE